MQLEPAQKKKVFLSLLCGLAALIVIVAAVMLALGGKGESGAGESGSSLFIPDNELLVNDIYEGERLIPKFEMPLNEYDVKKFTQKDGFVHYDDPNARVGVDVSEHQGSIDWVAVKNAGVDFAILRLGYRGLTQGLLNVDETFEQNLTSAGDAGLFVGAYFFSQAVTEAEAIAEADFVIETLNGRKLAYPIVYDWEQPIPSEELPAEDLRAHGASGGDVTKFAAAFCKRIQEAGYTPCVYTNKTMAYEFFDLEALKEYDLWYAEYQNAPSLYYDFRIWQYAEDGVVPGIDGGVDLNICFQPY